jgi:hypothetical protein
MNSQESKERQWNCHESAVGDSCMGRGGKEVGKVEFRGEIMKELTEHTNYVRD